MEVMLWTCCLCWSMLTILLLFFHLWLHFFLSFSKLTTVLTLCLPCLPLPPSGLPPASPCMSGPKWIKWIWKWSHSLTNSISWIWNNPRWIDSQTKEQQDCKVRCMKSSECFLSDTNWTLSVCSLRFIWQAAEFNASVTWRFRGQRLYEFTLTR